MKNATEYKTYTIEVNLKIDAPVSDYSRKTLGESTVKKVVVCPAAEVRQEATKIVRQAVANFSESVTACLAPIIADEPKLGAPEAPEALEV